MVHKFSYSPLISPKHSLSKNKHAFLDPWGWSIFPRRPLRGLRFPRTQNRSISALIANLSGLPLDTHPDPSCSAGKRASFALLSKPGPRFDQLISPIISARLGSSYHDSATSSETLSKCFLFLVSRICLCMIAALAIMMSRSPIGNPLELSSLASLPYLSQTGRESSKSSMCSSVDLTCSRSPFLPLVEYAPSKSSAAETAVVVRGSFLSR